MDAIHEVLDPWLGKPRYKQSEGRVTFGYRFASEETPPLPLRLKVEINTREHFSIFGLRQVPFAVESRWFEGKCKVPSYGLDELLGTKLRALYQRRKGRDLFDLALGLDRPDTEPARIIEAFQAYMEHSGHRVTPRRFEENLQAKLENRTFAADIGPLLVDGHNWNLNQMAARVSEDLLARLPDE